MPTKKKVTSKRTLTYTSSGVSYSAMDSLKLKAQTAARNTAKNLKQLGMTELSASRGESAYVVERSNSYFACVEECLGTKTVVANAMRKVTGKSYYDQLAQDTIAMMVNDLLTVGATPAVVLAYWAMGRTELFKDKELIEDLINGWEKACDMAGVAWGGGESPTLSGVLEKDAVDLAGACFGYIKPKKRLLLGDTLKAGDAIIFLESSGIHANGVSLARKIADSLPKKFATKMANGRMFGEAILDPTHIYAKCINELFSAGIDIHYIANITGHGWRKIMRCSKPFTYRIGVLPPVPEVLRFMVKHGPLTDSEAYATLNMGAGYALFVNPRHTAAVIKTAHKNKLKAYLAGSVEKGKKAVIIEPKNIVYDEKTLQLRAE